MYVRSCVNVSLQRFEKKKIIHIINPCK